MQSILHRFTFGWKFIRPCIVQAHEKRNWKLCYIWFDFLNRSDKESIVSLYRVSEREIIDDFWFWYPIIYEVILKQLNCFFFIMTMKFLSKAIFLLFSLSAPVKILFGRYHTLPWMLEIYLEKIQISTFRKHVIASWDWQLYELYEFLPLNPERLLKWSVML